jgi:phage terminase small subunit
MSTDLTKVEGLNLRQQRFATEYLNDLNATQAAIRAGYSPAVAGQIGYRLLKNAQIATFIADLQDERAERVNFTADEVLRELAAIVRSNILDYVMTDQGTLELANGASPDAMKAVASIKRKTRRYKDEEGTEVVEHDIEYRLWDKNAAIEKAMKHLGLLKDGPSTGKRLMRFIFTNEVGSTGVEVLDEPE